VSYTGHRTTSSNGPDWPTNAGNGRVRIAFHPRLWQRTIDAQHKQLL
jgi:hypothetical protein